LAEIPTLLRSAAEKYADQPALITTERILSWRETADLVARLSAFFSVKYPSSTGRVALTGSNSIDYLLAILAIIESGAVACPISNRLPEVEQRHLADSLGAPLLDTGALDWSTVDFTTLPELSRTCDADRPATVIATSGSSGQPKFAVLSIGNHYYSALGSHENLPFQSGDRWLVSLPLYHVGGIALLFRAMLFGGALVILEPGEQILTAIREHRITHLSLVPAQLHRMLSEPMGLATIAPSLTAVLIGGGAVSAPLLDRALEAGLPIHTSYGLTEMASQVTTTGVADPATRLFTSGRLLQHRELRLSADGEILVRGKTRFLGYHTSSGLTTPFDSEGWFATGDIGELDEAGYLTVRGRKDNMFISGGENIHPEEIETALCRLPDVLEVVTVAIPDDEFGERPVAFVRLEERVPFDDTRFVTFLERFLPRFKIPDEFFPWPDDAPIEALKPDRRWFAKRAVDILNR
jgi:O-succinylbenzoic acid--CoA ligase